MRATIAVGFCFAAVTACMAEQLVADYDWSKLAKAGQLLGAHRFPLRAKMLLKWSIRMTRHCRFSWRNW